MGLVTTPAVLLRAHPYSESSRILRFHTRDLGLVGALARGVRSASGKGRGGLESFSSGTLTLFVKGGRELHTFQDFTPTRPRGELGNGPIRMGGASAAAELVLRHAGEDANAPLFERLEEALDRIGAADEADVLEAVLAGCWGVVSALGYRPVLDDCVECGSPLGTDEVGRFDAAAGGVRCAACARERGPRVGPGARAQLRALVSGAALPAPLSHARAHLGLLGDFVTHHVSGARPLASFAFLSGLLPDE